ncbi:maleylpyruvate isomerase family mycothiol-dependent enzyme [Nocardia sp. BMG51109]|uniref:maleylpyruvate isomerase family mycothiol-dependent enzyme n=1 Tax=Nocardia sp. BMG51109 TaxID=1056816 RepID=UPI000463D55A|nr:maleylpyruvate isomerase family mycothiol-dependent enzyme [Nocardia sp. BMG51109]
MTSIDIETQRTALVAETSLLADLYRTEDPTTPIPTCPDWTLANLVAHVGGGHRWAAAMITDRATEFLEFAKVPNVRRPRDAEEADRWLRGSADIVVESVDATGPDVPVWTPFGDLRPAEWWVRRRLHESTAHRADALLALGRPVALAPELAADGLSELLGLIRMGSPRFQTPLDEGTTVSLHATDTGDDWSIRRSDDGIDWEPTASTGSVTVEAPAVELFLLLLRRIPADHPGLTVSGADKVLATWLERTAF